MLRIEKLGYSSHPWRLLTEEGIELEWSKPFKHPDIGITWVKGPICGETKKELVDEILCLLEILAKRQASGVII